MGRSEGGLAVVTMQQSPHTNTGGVPGNMSVKDCKSNDKVKVMNDEEANDDFPIGMRVLVVDDDPICLLLLESLLRRCKYNVTSCGQAIAALNLLRENKDKFDLVISDVYMPDMDGFKLLELVGLEMDLPVIMMSANGETSAVMKGITHGACDYLLKPVRLEELKNIWQHVVRKKRTESKDHDNLDHGDANDKFNHGAEDGEHGSSANDGTDRSWKLNRKRKEQNDDEDDDEDEHDIEDPSTSKKPRVVWSVELHQQFVNAVNTLGIDKAVPKRILELMNVQGLTRENVASHLQKYRLYLKRLSGVASQQGSMGNAFGGGRESSFASLCQVDGIGDLQVLAQSGQLSARALESLQAGVLGRLSGSVGLGLPGLNPSGMLQFASLPGLGSNNSIGRAQGIAPVNNPGNAFPCLSTGLELDQLQQKQQIARLGDIASPVDDPAGFRTMQRQLTATNSLPVGLGGGSSGNISVNSTNNALVLQLMQQQQQKHGRGLTTLTTERTVSQRLGASDINMVISSQLPNTNGNNGNWGNGAVVSGLATNARSVGGPLSSTGSGVQNLRESFLSASNVDCMSMDISVPPVNSFVGPSPHHLNPTKDLSLSSISAMNNSTGNISEVVPTDNRRPKLPILGNMNAGLGQGMNQIIKKDWQNRNQDFGTISNPLLNTQLSRASLLNQKIVGSYIAQPQGQNTGFCDQKMNLDFKLPVNSVVPGIGGRCESEQSTADSQMKLREGYPIDHVKMENGFLSENCNSGDELMSIFFKQQHEGIGFTDCNVGCDGYPLETCM